MKCPGNHPPFWICLRNPQKWKTHFPKKIPLLQFPLGKCRTIIHSANSDIAYNLNDPMILYHTFPILPHIITSFSIVFPPPIQGCSWLARFFSTPLQRFVPFGALPLMGVERSGGMKQSYLGDGGWVEACRSTWGKDGKACRIDFANKKHWWYY